MQRHALPGERNQDRTLGDPEIVGAIGSQYHGVQRGVQHHRMNTEAGHRYPGVGGQGNLGEHFVAATPHRIQPRNAGP